MRHPAPNRAGAAAELWRQAARQRLVLPRCAACAKFQWPPRSRCACGGALAWQEASGRGRIAAFSIVRRAPNAELGDAVPYVLAFVELDEGVRMFGSVADLEPEAVRAGMRVRCRYEPTDDPELAVPVFTAENA